MFFLLLLNDLFGGVARIIKGYFPYCVACVAWQTHRDHVVRPLRRRRRRCRRHTFRFRSITFEGMY